MEKKQVETNCPISSVPTEINENPDTPVNSVSTEIHQNPKVYESIKKFENGEMNHKTVKCTVCQEIKPLFHVSFENKDNRLVNINNVKLNKNNVCQKCLADNKKRKPKKPKGNNNSQDNNLAKGKAYSPNNNQELRAAKWSGIDSPESDLGPKNDIIRHNNMHFGPIPDPLKNLTTVELALISKITVCMRVHMLRHGMMSSKGHSVSIPQRMSIATQLPKLPEEVCIVILKRRGKNQQKIKHYTVQRKAVEDALKCLCFGIPNGGYNTPSANTRKYNGPNHKNMRLTNKYFVHFPNPYYNDVEIIVERLNNLPTEREEYSGLKTVFMENDIPENEKGPAPAQFEVPFSADDESYTSSSIILPAEPKDVSEEIKTIVKNVTGSEDIANTFALAEWKYADEEPLSELKTPGFFAQAFPSIFTGATCDFTHNPLVTV